MSEADDVLDFINLLPDSKSGTPHPPGDANNEELLDFLDELAEEDKDPKQTATAKKEAKSDANDATKEEEPKPTTTKKKMTAKKDTSATNAPTKDTGAEATGEATAEATTETKAAVETDEQLQESLDVVNAILSWWGSGKGLLGSLATNAQQISEQTYQNALNLTNELNRKGKEYLASEDAALPKPDINSLGARLNSLLTNVSSQITQGLMSEDDELLNILLVYDAKLKYLDLLVSAQFKRVMTQVEGGIAVNVTSFNHSNLEGVDDSKATDLSMFYGKLVDGDKLCYANLELLIKDYHRIAQELAEKQSHLDQIELNQLNLFVCIQPVCVSRDGGDDAEVETIAGDAPGNFSFTVVLKDITNDITIATKTQPFPLKWAQWLNGEDLERFGDDGDVDPAQWVRDWIRKGLDLSFGVLAQEYVIKRMGY